MSECELYVSPRGHDNWPGTRQKPFSSVERAQAAVRQVRARTGGPVVVVLADGTYELRQPLTLTAADSGQAGKPVVWRADAGATPTLSGGRDIAGWRLVDPSRGIYRAPARGIDTRQLYVDGARATRARATNLDPGDFVKTETGYEVSGASAAMLAGLARPQDAEITSKAQWRIDRCGIASVDVISGGNETRVEMTMDQPCFRNANLSFAEQYKIGKPETVENALELLDEPGEWYLDKDAGWLYYKPRPGEDLRHGSTKVVAPVLQAIVQGLGTMSDPVHDLRFEGLTFAEATWLEPNTSAGYAPDQTEFRFPPVDDSPVTWAHPEKLVRTPGNVRFEYDQRIAFADDHFTRLGAVGLDFDTGSQENTVVGSRFDDISGAAIQVGGLDPEDARPTDPRQLTRDNQIADNVVTEIGQEYYDAPGIFVGYTKRSTVEHNELTHLPYSGINVGWGFGLSDPGGTDNFDSWTTPPQPNAGWAVFDTPTASEGNRVLGNRIDDYMSVLTDGGGVYTLGWQGASMADGMTIEGNVATEPHHGGATYYTDAGSRFVTVRGNVDVSPDLAAMGSFHTASGGCAPYGDLLYEGNYWSEPTGPFLPCGTTGPGEVPTNVQTVGNVTISSLEEAPEEIVSAAGPR